MYVCIYFLIIFAYSNASDIYYIYIYVCVGFSALKINVLMGLYGVSYEIKKFDILLILYRKTWEFLHRNEN